MCQHFTRYNIRIMTSVTAYIYMFNIVYVKIVFVLHVTLFWRLPDCDGLSLPYVYGCVIFVLYAYVVVYK